MNWLAHLFLSADPVEYRLGNLLADPLKGRVWDGASVDVQRGFTMHRRIDAFTDSHSAFRASKARLGGRGYLRGVVVDVVYDHLLVRNWATYSSIGHGQFVDQFFAAVKPQLALYPESVRGFVSRLEASDTLLSYQHLSGIETALRRLDTRLPERIARKDRCSAYLEAMHTQLDAIETDFLTFFPELVAYLKEQSGEEPVGHWIR